MKAGDTSDRWIAAGDGYWYDMLDPEVRDAFVRQNQVHRTPESILMLETINRFTETRPAYIAQRRAVDPLFQHPIPVLER